MGPRPLRWLSGEALLAETRSKLLVAWGRDLALFSAFEKGSLKLSTYALCPDLEWLLRSSSAGSSSQVVSTLSLLCPIYSAPFSHHLVARVYESKAEFRSALQHEKEGYTIYKTQVGFSRGC